MSQQTDRSERVDEIGNLLQRRSGDSGSIVQIRALWNWQDSTDDVDVEFKLSGYAQIEEMIRGVRDHEDWTVRFIGISDSDEYEVTFATVYYENVDVSGIAFFQDV